MKPREGEGRREKGEGRREKGEGRGEREERGRREGGEVHVTMQVHCHCHSNRGRSNGQSFTSFPVLLVLLQSHLL